MSKRLDALLDFWVKNNMNVILEGSHGFGKTAMVKAAFERNGLRWKYFSASTMDPWVDLVGVPKEYTDEDGDTYLRLIRPKEFQKDEYDAIFFDEFNRCISGDTVIPLLDGNNVAIKDLVGRKEFFVYAFDQKTRTIKAARGHSARKTSRDEPLLKITLDNGRYFKCTLDHPILNFDGEFVRADTLVEGQSLLPLYRVWDSKKKNLSGYEWVWQPKKNSKWELTYHMADAYNLRNGVYTEDSGNHRHHVDFTKGNNSPRNIVRLNELDHIRIHANDTEASKNAGRMTHVKHPNLYASTLGTGKFKGIAATNSAAARQSTSHRELRSAISAAMYTPEMRAHRSKITKKQWEGGNFSKIDRMEALKKNHLLRTVRLMMKFDVDFDTITLEDYTSIRESTSRRGMSMLRPEKVSEWFGSFDAFIEKAKELKLREQNGNHRVVSIEVCPSEDVYDITVDEYENFAIDCGIFVHNSPKKVRNAVMELIQFKSINGHKFNNLKVVWAAINPHDDEETYDVEKLDPAQLDRFHVCYQIHDAPDKDFFYEKYGAETGRAAIEWWNGIPEKIRKEVSARRLEYVLDCYLAGGDVKYLVPKGSNPSKLLAVLSSGSVAEKLKHILESKDDKVLAKLLKNDNNFDVAVDLMKNDPTKIKAIVPFIDEERLMRLTHDIPSVREFVTSPENIDNHADMLRAVLNSGVLPDKEETRLRAVLSRGVVTDDAGVVIYEPRPSAAVMSQEEVYEQIRSWTKTLATADSETMVEAYDILNLNLCEPRDVADALNVLCVLFRFIDKEKHDMLATRYTKLIPMINYIILYFKSKGLDINDPDIKTVFNQGHRKLRSTVRVQGFLDSHYESFIVKPRIM